MVNEKEIYSGVNKENKRKYKRDIVNRYGRETFVDANKKVRKMTNDEWNDYQNDLDEVFKDISKMSKKNEFDSDIIQNLIAEHHSIIERLNKSPKESYIELANLYNGSKDMKTFFNKYKKGLSKFLNKAMKHYAKNKLSNDLEK